MDKKLIIFFLPPIVLLAIVLAFPDLFSVVDESQRSASVQDLQLSKFELRYLSQFKGMRPLQQIDTSTTLAITAVSPFRENPFKKPDLNDLLFSDDWESENREFRLQGILWDESITRAVINEKIVKPGDWLGPYKIVKINRKNVVLQDATEAIVLNLSKNPKMLAE